MVFSASSTSASPEADKFIPETTMAIRTPEYLASNINLAKQLADLPSDQILRRLADMSDRHPELRVDVAREIVKVHTAQYPDIKSPGLLARAKYLLEDAEKFPDEKREWCMMETRKRDPIAYGVMQSLIVHRKKEAAEKNAKADLLKAQKEMRRRTVNVSGPARKKS
jgi:hypothetical protein